MQYVGLRPVQVYNTFCVSRSISTHAWTYKLSIHEHEDFREFEDFAEIAKASSPEIGRNVEIWSEEKIKQEKAGLVDKIKTKRNVATIQKDVQSEGKDIGRLLLKCELWY